MISILIVDDDHVTRIFLEELLHQEGYQVVLATNGQEALVRLDETWCDLIFMDIQMPVMDGYQATQLIKAMEQRKEWFIPVIFLTSVLTDQELAHCLECGGDDFLTKPPNPIILKARLHAWLQRADLVNRLAMNRLDLENVILKMRQDDQFDRRGLRVLMTPLEKTNGDIVLSACRSDGVQYLVVGDFTGHGLAAAVCGPLVSDIFYRLTLQNVPLHTIISKINATIFRRLPVNMFMAAAFLEMDRAKSIIRIWNAAMPAVILIRSGEIVCKFPPTLPPLGIGQHSIHNESCAEYSLTDSDRIYLYSDGIVETRSPACELFGEERLDRFLKEIFPSWTDLRTLLKVLESFRAGQEQTDDITLVEARQDQGWTET
ncbi:MAG: SpoIIE family protein phosphatase [Magnetococcales bacterium]|nr:SpoIIE family protein phosphatase [Magnetococcales bacterium]